MKIQCRICLYAGYNSHVLYHKKSCLRQDKRLFICLNPETNSSYLCLFGCDVKDWPRFMQGVGRASRNFAQTADGELIVPSTSRLAKFHPDEIETRLNQLQFPYNKQS